MTTKQPNWELVANLGDVNVADYGGFLVYRDTTGVYAPEVEMYEPDEPGEKGGMVYRFSLDPPRFKTLTEQGKRLGIHSADLPASQRNVTWYWYQEWFVRDLASVASSAGTTVMQLLRDLFSDNPVRRASAYREIVGHFGAYEFDSYPLRLTEEEAQERYSKIKS